MADKKNTEGSLDLKKINTEPGSGTTTHKSESTIKWLDWSGESFANADLSDKLILLLLSAEWCAWCKIFDEQALMERSVAEFVNENFIAIKADVERYPDVADRYLQEGGYPTFCLLTPDGEIIYGGNAMPAEQFLEICQQINRYYRDQRETVLRDIAVMKNESVFKMPYDDKAKLADNYYDNLIENITENYDSVFGGFGENVKYPHPDVIETLLYDYEKRGEQRSLSMAIKTLDAIKDNLFDKVDGGFHRFSATEDWKTLQYEKMLEDNCKIIDCYLHAVLITPSEDYEKVIRETLNYLERELWSEEYGAFFSSQATDRTYYTLDSAERAKSEKPYIDKTVLTTKNAIAFSTLLRANIFFKEQKWGDMARRVLEFLVSKCYSKKMGFAHFYEDGPKHPGLLMDQEAGLSTLLNAYSYFQAPKYLELAEISNSYTMGNLKTHDDGALIEFQTWDEPLGRMYFINKPFTENSLMIRDLVRLGALTGNRTYIDTAEKIISEFAETHIGYGYFFAAPYVLSVEAFQRPIKIKVVKGPDNGSEPDILKELFLIFDPRAIIMIVDAGDEDVSAALGGDALPVGDLAVICDGAKRSKALTDIKNIRKDYRNFITN